MPLAMQEIIPMGLCIATQDLIDAKRFRQNFADNIILRAKDRDLERKIAPIKQELNSYTHQRKYLEGHKTAIISNIDKIIVLASLRYSQIDANLVSSIVANGKLIIGKILNAETFDKIAELEPIFKSQITLPVYDLFIRHLKKMKIMMV